MEETLQLHLCTENPCPVRDKEALDILNNGIQTTYTEGKVEVLMLPCLECGQSLPIKANGVEIRYGLNIFCHDKDCEDKYAWKQ